MMLFLALRSRDVIIQRHVFLKNSEAQYQKSPTSPRYKMFIFTYPDVT